MRKSLIVSSGLCLMLALSGTCVSAAEPAQGKVFEAKESGVVITFPEEYQSLKGTVDCADFGNRYNVGEGWVELSADYYPFDEEEWVRRMEEEGEAEDNGETEKALELLEAMQSKSIFHIIGLDEGRGVDELKQSYLDTLDPEKAAEYGVTMTEEYIKSETENILSRKYIEIGTCDGFTYILMAPNPERLKREELFTGFGDEYFDEYLSLVENIDKVVDNIRLTGGVELIVPVELAESGKGIHFETTDLDGNPVDSADLFAGHPVTMLNLWATWCGPCIGELPELEKLNQEFLKDNCQIVGIVTDAENDEKINKAKEILAGKGVSYVNLASFEGLSDLLPQDSWPTSYFVDENGCLIGEPVAGARQEEYPERMKELVKKQ